LVAAQLDGGSPLWKLPPGVVVARRPAEMAAAVAAMLRIAETIVLVDPYFSPDSPAHRRTLEAFLRTMLEGRTVGGPGRLEVQTSVGHTGTRPHFENECKARLPGCIPAGARLKVIRLEERSPGERLHNRYILTDVGGVVFVGGLDHGN